MQKSVTTLTIMIQQLTLSLWCKRNVHDADQFSLRFGCSLTGGMCRFFKQSSKNYLLQMKFKILDLDNMVALPEY